MVVLGVYEMIIGGRFSRIVEKSHGGCVYESRKRYHVP